MNSSKAFIGTQYAMIIYKISLNELFFCSLNCKKTVYSIEEYYNFVRFLSWKYL